MGHKRFVARGLKHIEVGQGSTLLGCAAKIKTGCDKKRHKITLFVTLYVTFMLFFCGLKKIEKMDGKNYILLNNIGGITIYINQ